MPISLTVKYPTGTNPDGSSFHFHFTKEEILIGRAESAEVCLPHPAVSLDHVHLIFDEGHWQALDSYSTNRTLLDGKILERGEPAMIEPGCRLNVGPFEIIITNEQPAASTKPTDTVIFARQIVEEMMGAGSKDNLPRLEIISPQQRGLKLVLETNLEQWIIGRAEQCQLRLIDADASRQHAQVSRESINFQVSDLGSRNGVQLNGQLIKEPAILHHCDKIVVGQTILEFIDPISGYLRDVQSKEKPMAPPNVASANIAAANIAAAPLSLPKQPASVNKNSLNLSQIFLIAALAAIVLGTVAAVCLMLT